MSVCESYFLILLIYVRVIFKLFYFVIIIGIDSDEFCRCNDVNFIVAAMRIRGGGKTNQKREKGISQENKRKKSQAGRQAKWRTSRRKATRRNSSSKHSNTQNRYNKEHNACRIARLRYVKSIYKSIRHRRSMESVPRHMMCPPDASILPLYNRDGVQKLWEECILYDVSFIDPYYAVNMDDYLNIIKYLQDNINSQKVLARSGLFRVLNINFTAFREAPFYEQKKLYYMYRFEGRMFRVKSSLCNNCQRRGINMKIMSPKSNLCYDCREKKNL